MASSSMISSSSSCKQIPFLIERKPLMLKDYLLDDLSSCSSKGFKSFPRSHCCTTVRFLLEVDHKTKKHRHQRQLNKRSKSSKAASTTISALQKASVAVINAVKLLPFPSSNSTVKSLSPSRTRKGLLPRCLSRKLFKKSFWRKTPEHNGQCKENNEIRGWRLFHEFLEEQDRPSDQTTSRISTSSRTSSNSNSNVWTTESESTVVSGTSTTSESFISGANDAVCNNKDLIKEVSDRVGVSVGQDSITNREEWPNDTEKEQFSPVSILDCPFQDDEEEISSPFHRSPIRMEGTKQKLMQKIRRFESLAQLDPVDLEKRIAMAELGDESLESPVQHCSMSIKSGNNDNFSEAKEENGTEKHAQELLKHVKSTIASHSLSSNKLDSLLVDFFTEKIVENNASGSVIGLYKEFEHELGGAQGWINGQPTELFLGWEVVESRHAYLEDMEKNGKWKNVDQEKEEFALELEVEVFNSLVDEALLDYILAN
ncbi:hypothetical protein D5086_006933 [Populus alba]|uniref:Uncharacterized protein n=2 Tax=Populus alba TaxID=43335 RepID=A0ACC4CLY2_POPAL|nr:uncharacterized protein LOC118028761 [Populus alba]TKS01076.1 hypothetical protein D5086_0000175590 [Populus alba]